MISAIRSFLKDNKASAIEYGAVIAIICVVVIGVLGTAVRPAIEDIFEGATDHVTDAFTDSLED